MTFSPTRVQLELIASHAIGRMPIEATAKALDIELEEYTDWLQALHEAYLAMVVPDTQPEALERPPLASEASPDPP
jgi:hypothetical protein